MFKDVIEILASLGGGGAIVFGLSGYLGKVWAARELEKQRQEYLQLNLELTHQLDLIFRRAQVELDALGHLHKLRIGSEFEKERELWKRIVRLKEGFQALPHPSYVPLGPSDRDAQKEYCVTASRDFVTRCDEAVQFLNEEMLSISKPLADGATFILGIARSESVMAQLHPDPFTSEWLARLERDKAGQIDSFFQRRANNLKCFCKGAEHLEQEVRAIQPDLWRAANSAIQQEG